MRSSQLCAVSIRYRVVCTGNAAHSFGDSSKRAYKLANRENARQVIAGNLVGAFSREDLYESRRVIHLRQS